ncbi:MAG: hypothetical protein Q8N23_08880 [Archangium sp.]|nr:hypothetical protein [Archangium sp.]MDP3573558.1 hypothetical protein [Archangium sp.]
MKPYRSEDEDVQRLHSACAEPLSNEPLPSLPTFVAALNFAGELSTTQYEGEPLACALLLIGEHAQLSGFSIPLNSAPLTALRSLAAAGTGGQLVVREVANNLELVGLDLPGYDQPFGIRFSFTTAQRVFVGASGLLVGASRAGRGITVFDGYPTPQEYLAPAMLGAVTPDRLIALLSATREHGHGGTIILDPTEKADWGTPLVGEIAAWGFASRPAELIDDPVARAEFLARAPVQVNRATRQRFPLQDREFIARQEERLSHVLRMLGRLTRSDGAVVVRPSLDLLAIGRRLLGDPPDLVFRNSVLDGPDDSVTPCKPSELGGTRIQSAIGFVATHPSTVALVVSSDGPVRMVYSKGNRVRVLEGVEAFL